MGCVPSSKNPKGCVPGSENPKGCVPGSKNPKGCGPCSVCLSQTVVRVSVSRPSLSRGPCFRVSKPSRGPCFRVSTLSRGPCFRVSWSVFPCLVVRVSVFLGATRVALTMWVSVFFRVSVVRVSVSPGQPWSVFFRVFPCFRVSWSVFPCFWSVFFRVFPCFWPGAKPYALALEFLAQEF